MAISIFRCAVVLAVVIFVMAVAAKSLRRPG